MTFNVWSDAPRNASWTKRREGIAELILRAGPDLLGLQEATLPMIRDLADRLGGYRWIGHGREDGAERGEFTPIFFRTERLALGLHATFWLAAQCEQPGRGWDAYCFRTVTWGQFEDLQEGGTCFHFNTHLDHLGRRARLESAKLLLAKIAQIAGAGPVALTGDFNCREASAPYRILTGKMPFQKEAPSAATLRDTRYETSTPPIGPRKTYRGWLSHFGIGRIDYIFVKNGFCTERYEVLQEGAFLSDHRPVIVDLQYAAAKVASSSAEGHVA